MANEKVNEYLEKRKKKLEAEGKTTSVKPLQTTDGPAKGGSFGDSDKVNAYLKKRQERIEKSSYEQKLLERDRIVGKKVAERETKYIRGAEEEKRLADRPKLSDFNRLSGVLNISNAQAALAQRQGGDRNAVPDFMKQITEIQGYREALNALPGMQGRAAAPMEELTELQSYRDALNALVQKDNSERAAKEQAQAFNFGNYLKGALQAGWAGFGSNAMKTLNAWTEPVQEAAVDALQWVSKHTPLPDISDGTANIMKGKPALGGLYDWAVEPAERAAAYAEQESKKGGYWAEIGNQVIQSTIQQAPNVVLTALTGSANLAADLGSQAAGGFGAAVMERARALVTSPSFANSYTQMYGQRFEDAQADGASAYAATLAATITTLMNAAVEAGSGVEDLPFKESGVLEWVVSALEEGREEVVQQVIDQLGQKAYINKDIPWFSMEDENAVINPKTLAENQLIGTLAGGLAGAPAAAINAAGGQQQTAEHFPEWVAPKISDTGAQILMDQNMLGLEEAKTRRGERTWGNYPKFTQEEQAAMQQENERIRRLAQQEAPVRATEALEAAAEANAAASAQAPRQRAVNPAIEQMAQEYGEDAGLFMAHYEGGDETAYKRGFDAMFRAGQSGLPLNMLGGVSDQLTAGMSEATKQAIYTAGRNKAAQTITPGAKNLTTGKLTSEQRTFLRVWDAIGKEYGFEVDLVDDVTGANGAYRSGGRRIVVSAKAAEGAYIQAAGHETVHYLKSVNPEGYNVLEDVVLGYLKDSGFDVENAVSARMKQYARQNLTREKAIEEIVAEAVPTFFGDKEAVRAFAAENRTLAEKIRDFFYKFVEKVREIAERYATSQNREEIRAIIGNTEALTEIAKTLDTALRGAQGMEGKDTGEIMTARRRSNDADDLSKWTPDARFMEEIMTTAERGIFRTIMNDRKNLPAHKMPNGEYVIEAGRALVYTDGKMTNPRIRQIVYFYTNDGTDLDGAMDLWRRGEREGIEYERTRTIIESILGEEGVVVYHNDDFREIQGKDNRRTGTNGRRIGEGNRGEVSAEEERLTEAGLAVSEDGEAAYPEAPETLYSLKTLPETDYIKERDKAAAALSKRLGVTITEAQGYIDNLTSISAIVAADQMRLDFEAEEAYGAVKPNSDYKWTVDFSTLCKKRLLYTGTFDAIQKQLADVILTENDYIRLREMMAEKEYEVACAFCYVESRRKDNGRIINEFLKAYREAQQGDGIMELGAKNRKKKFRTERGFDPVIANFNTSDGFTDILHNHRGVYDAYMYFMNARGVSKPKLIESRTAYTQEILAKFKSASTVKAMNRRGGLRLQSFSDFEVVNLLDMMQVVTDMSRVGLMSQAYTKVPEFARVFGGTGIKINLSLVTKGVDENGNLIFDDVEGMPHREAFRIREMYGENVGTVLVGKDDATIRAAMKDPRIDYIIPFHASGWSLANQAALGIEGYENYTKGQLETSIETGKTVKPQYYPADYWDATKTGDENAQIYLDMCRESGRNPKFPKFAGESGYWKMLIDFRMYDNEGNYAPQRPVRPDINMDEARRVLDEYRGGHNKLPVARDVVDQFMAEYREKHAEDGEIRLSMKSPEFEKWFGDSEVVNEDGTPKVVYHQTASDFSVFSNEKPEAGLNDSETPNGYFFKDNDHDIGLGGHKQMAVYLSAQNMLHFADRKEANRWYRKHVDGYDELSREYDRDMDEFTAKLKEIEDQMFADTEDERYDELSEVEDELLEQMREVEDKYRAKLRNMLDDYFLNGNSGYDGIELEYDGHRWVNGKRENVHTYIVFEPTQIKSATDNIGTFDPENPDIRYSMKEDGPVEAALEEDQNMRLPADVQVDSETIRRQAATAIQVGLRAKLNQQIKGVTARILKETGSKYKRADLEESIREIVSDYARHGFNDGSMRRVSEIAKAIIGAGAEAGADIMAQDADLAAANLALRIQGDVMGMIGAKNAAQQLYGSAQRMREQFRKEYEAELRERQRARVAEFQRIAGELKAAKEKGDSAEQKRIMGQYRTALKNVDAETAISVVNAANKVRTEQREEIRERAQLREKVTKRANELMDMLAGRKKGKRVPTVLQGLVMDMLAGRKKGKRVPTVLQGLVMDVLGALDINGEQAYRHGKETRKAAQFRDKLGGIRKFYEDVMDSQSKGESPEGLDGLMMTISERNMAAMTEALEVLGNGDVFTLREMNSEQLRSLNSLLKEVTHTVNSIGKLWKMKRYESIIELGDESIAEMDSRGKQKINEATAAGKIRDFFALDMMEPVSYGERLGEAGQEIIQGLLDGEKEKFGKIREASEATKRMLKEVGVTGRDIGKWKKHVQTVELGGKKVKMTDAMLMSLYLTAKRPQGRQHLLANGMRLPTTKETGAQVTTLPLTDADLSYAAGLLTDKQRALADRMGNFLSTAVAKWGNDVTQRMYLYDAFTEKNYWPITSDPNVLKTQEPEGERAFNAIINAGFTKPVNQKATNAVIVQDAFDVFGGHIGEMASYAGYAEVMTDTLAWLNYKKRNSESGLIEGSVKESVEKLLGKGGIRYLTKLVQDINGARRGGDSTQLGWLLGNYKKAAVMGKIRVAIQQPTSIIRAAAEINPGYLLLGLHAPKGTVAEMQKWSNLAWWKANGNYEIGVGKGTDEILWGKTSMGDVVMDKIATQGGLVDPGKMDDWAWARMWTAVKREVARTRKDLTVGSDEYFRAVAERFEYIMDRTQVVDTVMHRSNIMRSTDGLNKQVTSFMGEPIKSNNMLMRAVMEMGRDPKDAKARAKLVRSTAAYVASAAATAAATALVDAFRYRDDEEETLDYLIGGEFARDWAEQWLKGFMGNVNPVESVPFVSSIVSALGGEEITLMGFETFTDIKSAMDKLYNYFAGNNTKKLTVYGAVSPAVKALSELTGTPFNGIIANAEIIGRIFDPKWAQTKSSMATQEKAFAELYKAMASGDSKKALEIRTQMAKGMYGNEPKTPKQIDTGIYKELARQDERVMRAYEMKLAGNQTKELVALRKEIMADGFTEDQVNGAINYCETLLKGEKQAEKNMDEQLTANLYESKDLFSAIRSGDAADVAAVADYLEGTSTAKDPAKTIRSNVATEFKEEYLGYVEKGQTGKAKALAENLAVVGIEQEDLDGWVKDDYKADMKQYVSDGNVQKALEAIDELKGYGMDVSGIVSSLNSEYKERYVELVNGGRRTEADRLGRTLQGLGLYWKDGKTNYYRDEKLEEWLEED